MRYLKISTEDATYLQVITKQDLIECRNPNVRLIDLVNHSQYKAGENRWETIRQV